MPIVVPEQSQHGGDRRDGRQRAQVALEDRALQRGGFLDRALGLFEELLVRWPLASSCRSAPDRRRPRCRGTRPACGRPRCAFSMSPSWTASLMLRMNIDTPPWPPARQSTRARSTVNVKMRKRTRQTDDEQRSTLLQVVRRVVPDDVRDHHRNDEYQWKNEPFHFSPRSFRGLARVVRPPSLVSAF